MARRPPDAVDSRVESGGMSIRAPGAYVHVLRQRCAQEIEHGGLALTGATADELAADEADHRRRVAALVEVRRAAGEPVRRSRGSCRGGFPRRSSIIPVTGSGYSP